MLYPAELRAPMWPITRLGRTGPVALSGASRLSFARRISSEARVFATILAAVARGATETGVVRRTVIIGESARLRTGPVIVEIADRVGEAISRVNVATRLHLARQQGQRGQNCCGRNELQSGHRGLQRTTRYFN